MGLRGGSPFAYPISSRQEAQMTGSNLAERYESVKRRVAEAAERSGRGGLMALVVVLQ